MELKIPNTTSSIDEYFADSKNKLSNRNGLSKTQNKKFIDKFLKASGRSFFRFARYNYGEKD